jgi:hypothetical protein
LSERLMRIEMERARLWLELERRAAQGGGQDVEVHLRRLAALERYAQRCSSALRRP